MKTKIIKINSKNPEKSKIKIAAQFLKNNQLVAFPTETVYGLGANALSSRAVKRIFKAKGRPSDNPLIVHISNINQIYQLTKEFPKSAQRLTKKFWPGPLTLILKKSKNIPKEVTANLSTIAIRMPNNKIALELISQSKVPIAAPSANLSTKPSPTSTQHVFDDLKNKIPVILDGGKTQIGIESTVLDLTKKIPTILRPGKITKEQIESILKTKVATSHSKSKKPSSPGMKYKHYSPNAKVILIKNSNYKNILSLVEKNKNKKTALIIFKKHSNNFSIKTYFFPTLESFSKNLFKTFRECDKDNIKLILVESVPEKGFGVAIMNRLTKAADEIV